MVCKVTRPDPQTLFNQIKNQFSVNVLGGAPVIPESNEWYVVANDYAAAEQYWATTDQLSKETDPRYACCDNLFEMAALDGVFPRPASFAEGYVRLTGTPNAVLPSKFEITASNGQNYVTSGSVPSRIGSNGQATVRVRALTPGPDGNSGGTATSGTLVTAITGVNRTVVICGGQFCGGSEPETCDQFRQRYISRLQYKPRMTSAWIQEKLLEWPCATRAIVRSGSCCECTDDCGCANCNNQLRYYVMFDNAFPCGIAPQSIIDEINTWMFGDPQGYGLGQVEIGICGEIHAVTGITVNLRVDISSCPTASQLSQIDDAISDLFTTLAPSQPLTVRQLNLIVANIIGADKEFDTIIDPVGTTGYTTSPCGDLEPLCDYVPCLGTITYTNPALSGPGNC